MIDGTSSDDFTLERSMPKTVLVYAIVGTVLAFGACAFPLRSNNDAPRVTADQARAIADQKLASTQLVGSKSTFVELYSPSDNRCLTHEIRDPPYQSEVEEVKRVLAN